MQLTESAKWISRSNVGLDESLGEFERFVRETFQRPTK